MDTTIPLLASAMNTQLHQMTALATDLANLGTSSANAVQASGTQQAASPATASATPGVPPSNIGGATVFSNNLITDTVAPMMALHAYAAQVAALNTQEQAQTTLTQMA